MTFALDIDKLTCVRGHRVLFEALSLSLAAGAFVALLGPNGAGKTSLLRIIAGFLAPAAGMVRIRTETGETLSDGEDRARAVGWLGHQDAVKPQLKVVEQLSFWGELYGGGAAVLEPFGLTALADVPGQFLSAGQKRRLALARLTLTGRQLWLLDEPLAALDAAGKALVAATVRAHCAAGGIAIAATHEPLGVDGLTLRLGAA
jgi:heme exporter protein A